ncbi:MAG: spore germination protein [Ruminococcus sp.]|nr:spore germination protein [Ruminococcus sp.]
MLTTSLEKNTKVIDSDLRVNESFDLIKRDIVINNRKVALYCIDGFVKDAVLMKTLVFFNSVNDERYFKDADTFAENCVPYFEVTTESDPKLIIQNVLCGVTALIIDGFDKAVLMDMRTYPQRQTSEPDDDKVMRGSKDGFVETMISNVALIRRRIRDVNFTVKPFFVSHCSKSDVAVCYMDNKVDKKLLKQITDRINAIDVDSLAMNQQSLIEAIYPKKWYNPFPKIKYTERPDSAAANLLKGNIVILVDNSPSALILPTSIFDITEEADDYYFPPITGSYLRVARLLITIGALLITPVWLLMLQNPQYVPKVFEFMLLTEECSLPVFWQLILLEITIDGLRLAALNTPNSLSGTLGIIGAIALSEFSVSAGWFNTETILYMAFVTIASFSQPNYELGYCLKFMRVIILILTVLFNLWGFIAGLIFTLVLLVTNKTVSGKSYLYPLVPFNGKAFLHKVLRFR